MVGSDGGAYQVGLAPAAKWIACKACQNGSCPGAALSTCAQWIMDPNGNGSGVGRPDIVNNSWSGSGGQSWYQSFISSWVAAGIFPAFSNGNSGPSCNTVGSPADYANAFGAGATSNIDTIASWSSRGVSAFGVIKPDLVAPGVG